MLEVNSCIMGYVMYMCVCCAEDKKGGVDRSSTVIAKEPEGNPQTKIQSNNK